MECPNCSFQNMPGLKRCGRCASQLDLSAVDYLPPRASGGPTARALRSMREREAIALRQRAAGITRWLDGLVHFPADWTGVILSLLPGLGHVRGGRRRLGFGVMGLWFALVALMALYAGGDAEWLFYVMAVGLHCTVIGLHFVIPLQSATIRHRLATGMIICAAVNLLVYVPARWLVNRFVVAAEVNGMVDNPLLNQTLSNGDAIVYTGPWLMPSTWQRGDLVLIQIAAGGGQGYALGEGVAIDRIIATSGDVVRVDHRTLFVNGVQVPTELLPINGIEMLDDGFRSVIGAHQYFIVPSALALIAHGQNIETVRRSLIRQVSLVNERQIIGHVRWRLRPWSRAGTLPLPANRPATPDTTKAAP